MAIMLTSDAQPSPRADIAPNLQSQISSLNLSSRQMRAEKGNQADIHITTLDIFSMCIALVNLCSFKLVWVSAIGSFEAHRKICRYFVSLGEVPAHTRGMVVPQVERECAESRSILPTTTTKKEGVCIGNMFRQRNSLHSHVKMRRSYWSGFVRKFPASAISCIGTFIYHKW